MNFETRCTWRNVTGNQSIEPLRIYRASRIEDVVAIVREAERLGVTVKAVGSHHSWSDIACTNGFVIETHGLANVRSTLETDILRLDPLVEAKTRGKTLIETEAGIRLRELNAELERRGFALSNMGGYDEQTVAGVMSTSTHGSGIEFGPICEAVRSIDLIASGGTHYRIEPANGLTDPAKYHAKYPGRTLVQNDDWFLSALVSMGCFGVIVSVIMEVEPLYWLTERRTLASWTSVKQALTSREVLTKHRHYEVLFSPYANEDGDHTCLITTRDRAKPPVLKPRDKLERNPLVEIFASLPLVARLLNWLFDIKPKISPAILERGITALVDDEYTNLSYRVLNIGAANKIRAYSAEIAIPVDDRNFHIEAIERIFSIAKRHREIGEVYHTGPIALRFVKASPAYLSMMYGHDTMMIELILMTDTEGGLGLLAAYEDALQPLGGRPHWGQVNTLAGGAPMLGQLYPEYDRWAAVYRTLNGSGVFDNPFTKRVGIAMSHAGTAVEDAS